MIVFCILCLVLAGLFIMEENKEKYVAAVVLKGLASLCFVIVGAMTGDGSHLSKLVLAGLILGCIADVLLNLRWVIKEKGKLIFLVGILVFLSGHIVYLAAILPMAKSWVICFVIQRRPLKSSGFFISAQLF